LAIIFPSRVQIIAANKKKAVIPVRVTARLSNSLSHHPNRNKRLRMTMAITTTTDTGNNSEFEKHSMPAIATLISKEPRFDCPLIK